MLGYHFRSFYKGVVIGKFRTGGVCKTPFTELFSTFSRQDKFPEFSKKFLELLKYLKLLSL